MQNRFEAIDDLIQTRAGRRMLAKQSFQWFLTLYFPHFLQYKQPSFHREIIDLITNNEPSLSCIVAFRGSAKSTLCSLILPLWNTICTNQKKFVVIVCQSQSRSSQTLYNIRQELETNELLINDFGPFITAETSEWNSASLVLQEHKARISAVSVSESIRGIRHGAYRPDLIIADDIEDVQSAKSLEQRDKLWEFVNGELIPIGNPETSYIFIGNLVHKDSVMMRLRESIQSGKRIGDYREYPLLNEGGNCLWPGKYPNQKEVARLKSSLAENDFSREYLLKAINSNEQIIKPEWIQFYDQFPDDKYLSYYVISVDPAFSTTKEADKTAIICTSFYDFGHQDKKMYIHENVFSGKWNSPELVELITSIYKTIGSAHTVKIIVEQAGQQIALIDQLKSRDLPVEGVLIKGQDKSTRLWSASTQVSKGQIIFPRKGAEELIQQLLFFGSERFDDLADAFTLACSKHREYLSESMPNIDWI